MLNKIIAAILPYMPQSFVWIFSKRYVAGKTLNEAINVCKELNAKGILTTLDVLGEFIKNLDEAQQNKLEYLKVIEVAEANKINGNYSLKPSMFGLLLDEQKCYEHIREIVKKASEYGNFVRIDMEDSQCTDMEIELFRKLKSEFSGNVGLVLQAYLHRTMNDIKEMLDMNDEKHPLNYRICKGIYVEHKKIAYKIYDEINEHFLDDIEYAFNNKIYVGIASHDKPIIEGAYKLIEKYNVPKSMYEFQMLYGVTPELRQSIVDKGHKMRVYVPYGIKWFAYSTRRLKENPKMAGMILKALIKRG
jgi:proline dehydrogenase